MQKPQVTMQTTISFLREITGRTNVKEELHPEELLEEIKRERHNKYKKKKQVSFLPKIAPPIVLPKETEGGLEPFIKFTGGKAEIDYQKLLKKTDIIEETLEKFYDNEEANSYNGQRSSDTRLNIYFRQNARILKQIREQNQIVRSNNEGNIQQTQARLIKQFMFTVKDDCRDLIPMAITRTQQKLSKMIQDESNFKVALIVMVDNQLRVYKDNNTDTKPLKIIRMYQIQHVFQYDQPVKFLIISFVKDRSKPAQYLYLKFEHSQDQDKWDRILYINHKVHKMNKKEKLFVTDFNPQEYKNFKYVYKPDDYNVNFKQIVTSILKDKDYQQKQKNKSVREIEERQQQKQKQRQKQLTLYDKSGLSNQAPQDMLLTVKDPQNFLLPQHMTNSLRIQRQIINFGDATFQRANTNQFNNSSPKINTQYQMQRKPSFTIQPHNVFENSIRNIQKSEIIIDDSKQKQIVPSIQSNPSKIQQFQKQLKNGIYVLKINFLKNSKKILFTSQTSITYYDQIQYRQKQLAIRNNEKYKQIKMKEIFIQNIQKIQKQQKNSKQGIVLENKEAKYRLKIKHSGNKLFVVEGVLDTFENWLKLKCIMLNNKQ